MSAVPAEIRNPGAFSIEGERPPLVPAGKYTVRMVEFKTWLMLGRYPKLVLTFEIITQGEHFGIRLPRFYNVKRIIGRAERGGRFKVGWRSAFLADYARLFGLPQRLDRIPMSRFREMAVVAKVETVRTDVQQRPIPRDLRY